jgi:hypothetical protein
MITICPLHYTSLDFNIRFLNKIRTYLWYDACFVYVRSKGEYHEKVNNCRNSNNICFIHKY